MRTIYLFILGFVCAVTSCKTAIDKSVSEPLSREEMIDICKSYEIPNVELIVTTIGSEMSQTRQSDEALLIKYADLTYRDIIDYCELIYDSVKIKEFDARYDAYEEIFKDSVWNKITNIRNCIKNDTSFNKYARLSYELKDEYLRYVGKKRKKISMNIDCYDNDVNAIGGVVSKASINDTAPTLNFYFFELKKGYSGFYFKNDPTYESDTLDYFNGEFDYSINILWVKKNNETLYTSKEYWDLLNSNRTTSFFSYNPGDLYFYKERIINDMQLLNITDSRMINRSSFRDSLFTEQMTEKNIRAKNFINSVSF